MKEITKVTYQCDFCEKIFSSKNDVKEHENICRNNPKFQKIIKTARNEVEKIRKSSTSLKDLIQRIQEYVLSLGITITFNSFPCSFSPTVSNSHSCPKGYDQNWTNDKFLPTYHIQGGQGIGMVKLKFLIPQFLVKKL